MGLTGRLGSGNTGSASSATSVLFDGDNMNNGSDSDGDDGGPGTGGSDGLGAVSLTRLQALLKARTGEVKALQQSIATLEADKLALTNELVSLTTKNAQLYVTSCCIVLYQQLLCQLYFSRLHLALLLLSGCDCVPHNYV